jgi:hypothetical protein
VLVLDRRAGAPQEATAPAAPATPALTADPNDALFIPAPPGTREAADEVVEEADRLGLFVSDAEEAAYRRHGFRRLLQRSYYGGASGGAAIELVEVEDPVALLHDLEQAAPGAPYPDLPEGRIRDSSTQMENGAHVVTAYFSTVTFVSGPYFVEIEAYGLTPQSGRERVARYARDQHELLQEVTRQR